MTDKKRPTDAAEGATAAAGTDTERREALIKIGKYAAYTAPAMMVTVGTARAGAVTQPPVSPPPAPTSTQPR